jgi:hypothetical protein
MMQVSRLLERPTTSRVGTGFAQLPDRFILLFLCAVVAVGPLTTFGQFRIYLVLPLFLVLALLSWRLLPADRETTTGNWIGSAAALLIAVGWIAFNAPFFSEMYIVVRDPSIYTLRALWLIHHSSPDIPIGQALHVANGAAGVQVDAGGFPHLGSSWQPQGATLVPALMAVGGWFAGSIGVLESNLVVGAVALLAVYALARRIVGPIWALAPIIALSTSMPMVAFSRAPYTEPAALALGVGGIVLAWLGLQSRRVHLTALAGLSIGATFLARPDGLLFVLGGALGLGTAATFARSSERRRELRAHLLCYVVAAALSAGLGFVDLAHHSFSYEASAWPQIESLYRLTVVTIVVLVLATFVPGRGGPRAWFVRRPARWAGVTVGLVGVSFTALTLRPLYLTEHTTLSNPGVSSVANRQRALGLPVDGTLTYNEHTVSWLSWYYSWPVVLLAAAGVCLAVVWCWRRRDPLIVLPLAVLAPASALYLNNASITPDQIWAMRRFLPIVIPLGLVLAVLVPFSISRRWPKLLPLGILLGLLVALAPIPTWKRTLVTREYAGAKAFTAEICDAVDGSNVIIADHGPGGSIFLPTLRVECGTQAVLVTEPTAAILKSLQSRWGDAKPVVVMAFVRDATPWKVQPQGPYLVGALKVWNQPLTSRPQTIDIRQLVAYLGDLGDDGLVTPRVSR